MEKDKFSWRKRLKSFRYAFRGIVWMVKNEHNAWIHLSVAACVAIAGVVFGLSSAEWIAVIIVSGTVLAAEAANSAVEAVCNLVSPGYNELVKRAKDLAAGAVLLAAIAAALVGLIIFVPKILTLFN